LEKSGLDQNTVVIYTSDQGFYLGDHGWFDKRFMYEESLKMPFLMRYPGIKKQKNVNRDVITNIDFASTLLDIAGIEEKEELQGRSFLSNVLDENSKDWRQSMYYHYYEFPFWHHVQPHYGIRNEKFKLIHFYYNIDVWELYNLQNDPEEMTNLINDPTYNDVIKGMKLELYNLQMEYGDDKSLDEFRSITDANFGHIGGKGTRE
jgi:arylsulfatase A-like enzyme